MKVQFMLRDWLWFVLVVALGMLWFVDRQHLVMQLLTAIRLNEQQFAATQAQIKDLDARLHAQFGASQQEILKLQQGLSNRNAPPVIDGPIGDGEFGKPLPQPRPPRPNELSS
jgi:hypothetical protein